MPAFRTGHPRARLLRTTNFTLAAGANYVPWETAQYDDVGGWTSGTRYTLDRAGLYEIIARANRAAVATTSSLVIRVHVNGVNAFQTGGAPSTVALQGQCSDILELQAGDYVEMNVSGHGSTTSTLLPGNTNLTIIRVGPVSWR